MNDFESIKEMLKDKKYFEVVEEDEIGLVHVKTNKLLFTFNLWGEKELIDVEPLEDELT